MNVTINFIFPNNLLLFFLAPGLIGIQSLWIASKWAGQIQIPFGERSQNHCNDLYSCCLETTWFGQVRFQGKDLYFNFLIHYQVIHLIHFSFYFLISFPFLHSSLAFHLLLLSSPPSFFFSPLRLDHLIWSHMSVECLF